MFKEQKFIAEEIKAVISKKDIVPLFLYTGIYDYQTVNSHWATCFVLLRLCFPTKIFLR